MRIQELNENLPRGRAVRKCRRERVYRLACDNPLNDQSACKEIRSAGLEENEMGIKFLNELTNLFVKP